jgi:hypothetical protein
MSDSDSETKRPKNPLTLRDAMAEFDDVNSIQRRRKRRCFKLTGDYGLKRKKRIKQTDKNSGTGGVKLVSSYSRNASNQSRKW